MDQHHPERGSACHPAPATTCLDWNTAVPSLVRAARRQLGPRLRRHTTPEDLVQNAIVGALTSPHYRSLPGPALLAVIRSFLRRLPCQTHRSLHRQRRCVNRELHGEAGLAEALATDPAPAPVDLAAQAELGANLRRGILALRPADARLVRMRLDGCTLAELGTALGLRADSARKRAERAVERLRVVLKAARVG